MSLGITRRDIEHAHHALRRMRDVKEKAKERGQHITGTVVRSALVGGAALGLGTMTTRYPNTIGFGTTASGAKMIPTGLAAAVVLHALGFLNVAGKYDEHLHALGDGALAFYLATVGAGLGVSLAAKAGQPTSTTSGIGALPSGYRPSGASTWRRGLNSDELHTLAAQRRANPYGAGVHVAHG